MGTFSDFWLSQGNALYRLRRLDEALAAYDKALSLKPDLAEAWLGRANVFYNSERHEEALAAYDKAVSLKPDLAEAWHKRGIIQVIRGNRQEGKKDCEQAVLLGASKEAVDFNLARHGVIKNVQIVPRKIIEDIFDDHASYFDSHLVNVARISCAEQVIWSYSSTRRKNTLVDALDLGCGTGLMGEPMCLFSLRFIRCLRFSVLPLKCWRIFCFSVEDTNEGNYILTESGRYQHTKEYLEQLGHDNNLEIHAIEDCVIRKEGQRRVPGFLAFMSRLR
jgi:predicted TPR repeat methyltransferase